MKIAFAASEVFPYAKTGGLADVAGALPIELSKLGHEVKVFMPKYILSEKLNTDCILNGTSAKFRFALPALSARFMFILQLCLAPTYKFILSIVHNTFIVFEFTQTMRMKMNASFFFPKE